MSKTAEQKSLEAYPQKYDNLLDTNVDRRIGYRQGYDQAMQDFLNKACDWLSKQPMSRPVFWTVEDFKNYIEEEQ